MIKFIFISIILFLSSISLGVAGEKPFSVGLGFGRTYPVSTQKFTLPADSDQSLHLTLGYLMNDKWGLRFDVDSLGFDKVEMTSRIYSINSLYVLSKSERFHTFAKLGAGYADHDFKASGVKNKSSLGLKFDLGLEYNLTDSFSFQAGVAYHWFERITSSVKSAQALNPYVGLTFQFGDSQKDSQSNSGSQKSELKSVQTSDADGDGVPDENDSCPNTTNGSKVNSLGCVVGETAKVKINVLFATGSSVIDRSSFPELQKFADFLTRNSSANAHIKGYTDSSGTELANKKISQARANAVKDALVQLGVTSNRLQATGMGPADPVSSNSTQDGRKANRRVIAEVSAN